MDDAIRRVEYVVIGAGPGGLQLGWQLARQGRDYVILEAAETVGAFFATLPRSRKLISFNRVHGLSEDPEVRLRWDWNSLLCDYEMPFREFSQQLYPDADELVAYLQAFVERNDLNVRLGTRVEQVTRPEGRDFHITTSTGEDLRCRVLILATGMSRPHIPDVPGMDLVTEAYEDVTFDPASFAGQKVLVLGKGNSALEFVEAILDTPALLHIASPQPIQFAWNTHHPGHVRANYVRLFDTYQLKLLNGTLDCTIQQVRRDGASYLVDVAYSHADGETETLVYDRVVRATGFAFDARYLSEECRPGLVLDDRLPAMTSTWEAVDVPDLWFGGTLTQARDYKRAASTFIDGFRYNVRTLGRMLEARYHDQPLPMTPVPTDPESLAAHVGARISRTSALWAQFGYLCDVLAVDNANGVAYHLEELPLELTDERADELGDHWYRITFEWGDTVADRFSMQRHPSHDTAASGGFLHPVIRLFRGRDLVEEHHLLEDLFGTYSSAAVPDTFRVRNGMGPAAYHRTQHEEPLLDFFTRHHELRDADSRPRSGMTDLPHMALARPARSRSKSAATPA